MRFTKMHGIGNDYVYVNAFDQPVDDPAALAPRIADRHFGVGGDGLILLLPPTDAGQAGGADLRMRMFNADGSEAEMCGNGIRCVCKLAHDSGIVTANPMRIETPAGVLPLDYTTNGSGRVERVTVDMGEPILEPDKIPVNIEKLHGTIIDHVYDVPDYDDQTGNKTRTPAVFVSMGNPHAVVFTEAIDEPFHRTLGKRLETHQAFPARMNVHFVQVVSPTEARVLHWERGSGPTLACGTGACAACVAGVLTGRTRRHLTTRLPGGDLQLEWREADNHVYMTGPATEVFTGEWPQ